MLSDLPGSRGLPSIARCLTLPGPKESGSVGEGEGLHEREGGASAGLIGF